MYQESAFNMLSRYTTFKDKVILEVGGNKSLESVFPFINAGARKVVVSGLHHIDGDGTAYDGRVHLVKANGHKLLEIFGAEKFDIIYGLSVIEHITMPDKFLEQVFNCTKSGGFAFFDGNPIWSGPKGHHLWLITHAEKYAFNTSIPGSTNPIPDWGHLLMSKPVLYQHLLNLDNGPHPDIANKIVCQIYESNHINRLMHSEIATAYSRSGFDVLDTGLMSTDVPQDVLRVLRMKYGDKNDYGVERVRYVLNKS